MAPPADSTAELSSIETAVAELVRRVTVIAESYARAKRDDVAAELYEVERSLTMAQRGLARVVATYER